MSQLIDTLEHKSQRFYFVTSLGLVLFVGIADYLTGIEMSFSVFYLLGVAPATWFVGPRFGMLLSTLSVGIWLAGVLFPNDFTGSASILIWNAMITLSFYFTVVWLLTHLRSLNRQLEERVRLRTEALTVEMSERERLAREILNVGERERQRIGREFHDGLGQHLTATAMAGHVLQKKLSDKSLAEARDANGLVQMVERAIEISRQLVQGLSPVDMAGEGLMYSLRVLAGNIGEQTGIPCRFICEYPVLIRDSTIGMHLYRIAQEAVNNAAKHAQASSISIRLSIAGDTVTLIVTDDGIGLPKPLPKDGGMGLRIMEQRAAIIGASFAIERALDGGTVATCTLRRQV